MAEDEKTAGPKPCQEPQQSRESSKLVRKRAPDQDVLPGILGKQLKAAYSELLNTPIPDTFTDLIKRLEDKEPTASSTKSRHEEEDQ